MAVPRHSAGDDPNGDALGQRVGELVRTGDCTAGERMAREAGDFALLAAVRAYCRRRSF